MNTLNAAMNPPAFLQKEIERSHERHTNTEGRLIKVETELTDMRVGFARLHGDVKNTNQALGELNIKLGAIQQDTASLVSLDKGYKAWRGPLLIIGSAIFMMASALLASVLYFTQVYGVTDGVVPARPRAIDRSGP